MPDDLRVQIEPIMEMVRLSGWPLIQIAGVEADDVLATYAKRADALSWDVFIATGDKDLAQLVDGRIRLVNTMTRQVLDAEGVKAKYGVAPDRIIDYLALMGDKVDNVPGINKCGPVTAAKWINEWGSLDNLVAHAGEVKGKIGENLRAGLPFLETARKLVTINCAVELPSKPEELVAGAVDEEKLTAFSRAGRCARERQKPANPNQRQRLRQRLLRFRRISLRRPQTRRMRWRWIPRRREVLKPWMTRKNSMHSSRVLPVLSLRSRRLR